MNKATKERRADLLLCAAKHWQKGDLRNNCCMYDEGLSDLVRAVEPDYPGMPYEAIASAALSEVCALGFDIEGAEKVTSFERDGNGYRAVPVGSEAGAFLVELMMRDMGKVCGL
jgi:hypothetical protein